MLVKRRGALLRDRATLRWLSAAEHDQRFQVARRNGEAVPIDAALFAPGSSGESGSDNLLALTLGPEGDDAQPWLALRSSRSRLLPLYSIWRVPRFGRGLELNKAKACLEALVTASHEYPVLRCRLRLFDWDANHRQRLRELVVQKGFSPARTTENYTNTTLINLDYPCEEALFLSLGSTARRDVRRIERRGLTVAPIFSSGLSPELVRIEAETRRRTQGTYPIQHWARWLEAAAAHPDAVRISVLMDPTAGNAILAFALGVSHGDHVEYRAAASTRPDGRSIPLGYGPMWDLIRWAYQSGHVMFDFGGITHDHSPMANISAFKQRFSRNVVRVAEEFELEPHPIAAGVTRVLGRSIRRLTRN
ncbi:GNAT family N-acetyltransferase [Aquisalimonas lutea]|uniref:GNAT family N-acetyltransferase n=1 Tax=Aquisalimonas lutea TaxID=1327750 RepID=UPI0025B385AB|nr:GNAT family N-acetyltransferase [Aquisalimonas lutea]MDN3517207.1 GNAT family N-acetyltransferase [Aquisalimonas lutea]